MNKPVSTEPEHALLANQNLTPAPKEGLGALELDEKFYNSASWTAPSDPAASEPSPEKSVVMMLRRPEKSFPELLDDRFVMVHGQKYLKGCTDPAVARLFWDCQLSRLRPYPTDWLKSGPKIWEQMNLRSPKSILKRTFGLKKVDEETALALNAALFNAVNTAYYPDIDTIAFALATFIHAHSAHARSVRKAEWHLPFGEQTGFRLLHDHISEEIKSQS